MRLDKEFTDQIIDELALKDKTQSAPVTHRQPVHVVYGGANLFTSETPEKLGRLALASIDKFAPNFAEFGRAMWLKGADELPRNPQQIEELDFRIADDPQRASDEIPEAHFAWTVYRKTLDKLAHQPVEDFRIDFEDGYGFRSDDEEDGHSIAASSELARLVERKPENKVFTGFRIKSLQAETRKRAIRTLELFLDNLLEMTDGRIPEDFVVTLPKIKSPSEPKALSKLLSKIEQTSGLAERSIGIEIMVETPECIPFLQEIAAAAEGRCTSAHFGAYDYTSSLGISSMHQHIGHKSCDFARHMMQIQLSPLGIRLSDSVTTELPVPVNRQDNLSIIQIAENRAAVHSGWRKHFSNITLAQASGIYQGWDLHPAQLVPRFAAVYAFFLESAGSEAKRLRGFLDKATQAMTTGNIFDDLASAEGLLNFFTKGESCGAFSRDEILNLTGLTQDELESRSFQSIMNSRFPDRLA